jgi:hypothetical protein
MAKHVLPLAETIFLHCWPARERCEAKNLPKTSLQTGVRQLDFDTDLPVRTLHLGQQVGSQPKRPARLKSAA